MKSFPLVVFFITSTFISYAQSIFGLKTGVGFTTTENSLPTPTFGAEYLVSPWRHIFLGGSLFLEGYSFVRYDNSFSQFGGQGYTITHSSAFAFIAPKIDVGVGHNEYFHFFASCGIGFLTNGQQSIAANEPTYPKVGFYPGNIYDTGNTSKNINHTVYRIGFGIVEHIPFLKSWDIILSQEAGFIPTWISSNTYGYSGDQAMNIRTNYISLMVGIMYKHNWEPLKARRSWGGY